MFFQIKSLTFFNAYGFIKYKVARLKIPNGSYILVYIYIYIYIYVYIILFYVHFYSVKLNGTTECQERFSSRTEHLPEKNCLGMCTLFEISTIY